MRNEDTLDSKKKEKRKGNEKGSGPERVVQIDSRACTHAISLIDRAGFIERPAYRELIFVGKVLSQVVEDRVNDAVRESAVVIERLVPSIRFNFS